MGTTATFNPKACQASPGYLYMVAMPTALVALTTAAQVKELFEYFLVDGDKRDTLKEGVDRWGRFETGGLTGKIEQKPITVNPDDGPEEDIGFESVGFTGDMTVMDLDAAKLKDILSAVSAQILDTPHSVAQAGRTTVLAGGQANINRYLGLYRYESRQVPGEFRHALFLNATLTATGDRPFSAKKAQTLKVTLKASASDLLRDPVTGRGVIWLEDYVTAPKGA